MSLPHVIAVTSQESQTTLTCVIIHTDMTPRKCNRNSVWM